MIQSNSKLCGLVQGPITSTSTESNVDNQGEDDQREDIKEKKKSSQWKKQSCLRDDFVVNRDMIPVPKGYHIDKQDSEICSEEILDPADFTEVP